MANIASPCNAWSMLAVNTDIIIARAANKIIVILLYCILELLNSLKLCVFASR